MVHLSTLEAMREKFRDNLQQYVKEHPGEFVLFEGDASEINATFYKTRKELEQATAKYKGLFGPTFLIEQIPFKTHRFNKNNKTLEFLDYHVEVCPNDNETRLLGMAGVMTHFENGKPKYHELAYCPDCGYRVFRRPSEETIKRVEEHMEKTRFA